MAYEAWIIAIMEKEFIVNPAAMDVVTVAVRGVVGVAQEVNMTAKATIVVNVGRKGLIIATKMQACFAVDVVGDAATAYTKLLYKLIIQ